MQQKEKAVQAPSREAELATAPIGKLMAKMAVPCITAQIINALYNIVDRIYVGRMEGVGKTALAGLGGRFPADYGHFGLRLPNRPGRRTAGVD